MVDVSVIDIGQTFNKFKQFLFFVQRYRSFNVNKLFVLFLFTIPDHSICHSFWPKEKGPK